MTKEVIKRLNKCIFGEEDAPYDAEDLQKILDVLAKNKDLRLVRILRLRHGMDDGIPKTYKQIGKEFGVTRERIRQIEAKGYATIRVLAGELDMVPEGY